MVFPLKQYRRLLLLSVYLCTTTLLFISVIRVFTALDSTPSNQSSFSTFALGASMPYLTGERRSGFERVKSLDPSGTQGFDARTVPLTTNRSQTISLNVAGSTQIALNHPAIYVASILSPTPSGGTAIYPVRYEWFLDQHPSALTYRSNGITSTATITWSTAGIRVIGVSASTGIGEVAAPYTISVSALSPQLTSNQTTTFAYNESIGTGILIQIPAQALDRSVQMAYLPLGTVSAPQPKGYLGQAFQLNVQENGTNLDSFSFEKPTNITITYDDRRMTDGDEALLTLKWWNGIEWVDAVDGCSPPSAYVRAPERNQLSIAVCGLTQYALFGAVEELYLPILLGAPAESMVSPAP